MCRWHAGLLADAVGRSTAAKCYRLLRAIPNTAVEDRHLVTNPCTIKGGDRPVRASTASSLLLRAAEPLTPERQAALLIANLPAVEDDLVAGAVVVFARGRTQVRSRPIAPPRREGGRRSW